MVKQCSTVAYEASVCGNVSILSIIVVLNKNCLDLRALRIRDKILAAVIILFF